MAKQLLGKEVTAAMNEKLQARVADFDLLRNCPVDTFFDLRESFLFADGDVVPLVDAPRLEKVSQDGNDLVLPALHAARDDLKREAVGKFVDGQAGQAV